MSYTLGEAAKAVEFSKPTLSRAIKNGKLSAIRLEDGSYQIDAAELQRWKDNNGHRNGSTRQTKTRNGIDVTPFETPDSSGLEIEVVMLREQLRSAEAARGFLEERVSDLQDRAERAEAKEDKLLALISNLRTREPELAIPSPATTPQRGLWARLVG